MKKVIKFQPFCLPWYELTLECGHVVYRTDKDHNKKSIHDSSTAWDNVRCPYCEAAEVDAERQAALHILNQQATEDDNVGSD